VVVEEEGEEWYRSLPRSSFRSISRLRDLITQVGLYSIPHTLFEIGQ
jgi:hypothetical protein